MAPMPQKTAVTITTRPLTGITGSMPVRMSRIAWVSWVSMAPIESEVGNRNTSVSGAAMRNDTMIRATTFITAITHARMR